MIIGIDLDGTVSRAGLWNPSLKLPWWLFVFLVPIILILKPNKKALRKIKEMKDWGHKIIIVSARPPWSVAFTERWLIHYNVPFDKILCVGFGKGTKDRKLETIKREGIEHFFDDNQKLLEFFNHNSVRATRL